jgi:spore germination cell wall hydrolase CwlJ-like protein
MRFKTTFIIAALSAVVISATLLSGTAKTTTYVSVDDTTAMSVDGLGVSAHCLALNVYHEARDQGTAGLFGVTAVVLNRVNDKRFPNTICEVVYQGPTRESWKTKKYKDLDPEERIYYPIKNKCQFSWYCDGKNDTPHNKEKYQEVLDLVKVILYNELPFVDITDGALFYHADYVTPGWAKTKQRTIEIEDHIFYRWDTK